MRPIRFLLIAVATTAGLVALVGPAPGHADEQSGPYVTDIRRGIATGGGSPRPMKQAT
jgi:hypothetical protein